MEVKMKRYQSRHTSVILSMMKRMIIWKFGLCGWKELSRFDHNHTFFLLYLKHKEKSQAPTSHILTRPLVKMCLRSFTGYSDSSGLFGIGWQLASHTCSHVKQTQLHIQQNLGISDCFRQYFHQLLSCGGYPNKRYGWRHGGHLHLSLRTLHFSGKI